MLDDFSAIKENNIVRQGLPAMGEIFTTSYRQGYLSVKDGLYRPLSLATFAAEWHFFPDQPGLAHFNNSLLYGFSGMLLFFVLLRLMRTAQGVSIQTALWISLITSLLFIVHPLHSEVVANIKSRDEMLCLFFVLLSWLAMMQYLEKSGIKWLASGCIAYFLSLLSKETSITFLAILPAAFFFFSSYSIKKIMLGTAPLVVTAIVYLLMRTKVLDGALTDDTVSAADNILMAAQSGNDYFGTAFLILGKYLQLFLIPHPLSYDYSFRHIPLVNMTHWSALLSLLIYISLAAWLIMIMINVFNKRATEGNAIMPWLRLAGFGILFFLSTMILFSNLLITIGTSMGDRLMYFPSLGLCFLSSALLLRFSPSLLNSELNMASFTRPVAIFLIAILVGYSVKTYSRNTDWKDNYTLYSHDVSLVPESVKAHYYLGLEMVKVKAQESNNEQENKEWLKLGIQELERAVEIMPTFGNAFTQMGVAWYRLKDFQRAIDNYNKAESLKPLDAVTINNIGSVYFEWGKYTEAEAQFRKAVELDRRFVDAWMNLGSVQGTMNRFQEAIESFGQAIHYAPDHARGYFYLGITYENMGNKKQAQEYFKMAERLDPKLKR